MTTSGTYAFEPTVAEFVDEAFERCGIDPAGLTVRHLRSARRSLNIMFAAWNTRGVKLWTVDEQTQTLTASDPSYNAVSATVAILEMFVRRDGVDTPVWPMSRSEYAAIPNKSDEGLPTRFYFDRAQATPTITLWSVPENSTDVIHYFRMRRLQDVGAPSKTLDIPTHWSDALASGLAARLALKFAPDRLRTLEGAAEAAFLLAKEEDRERGDTQMELG